MSRSGLLLPFIDGDSYRAVCRFPQQNRLPFHDIRAFQPDFFGGVAVNDHRARVNSRFQDCQHRAGELGNGLAKKGPLRHLQWESALRRKIQVPSVCRLNREILTDSKPNSASIVPRS